MAETSAPEKNNAENTNATTSGQTKPQETAQTPADAHPEKSTDKSSPATQTDTEQNEYKSPIKSGYLVDFSQKYHDGTLNKIVGRKDEIDRLIHVLLRTTKSSPLLIGPVGVGKTALAEGVAMRMAQNKVPAYLKGSRIVFADTASMLIDSTTDGEFREHVKDTFQEVIASKGKYIIFVNDPGYLCGKGAGTEIAKFLKPKVVSGDIRVIATTDLNRFKIMLEPDIDIMRALQPIYVEEPTLEETTQILEGARQRFEDKCGVVIPDETIKTTVDMSDRYIKQRLFPEKAIDLLDEAASFIVMEIERGNLKPEENTVKPEHVGRIVSMWTGIPVEKVGQADKERLLKMEDFIEKRVIGQPEAVGLVSGAIRRSRSGLQDPERPIGTFMFIGTTGVGKTELAKALAEFVFNDETAIVRLDMSEYMEKPSVARMVGPPPGTPGFENGGVLTEAVRMRPYQVVLFDELEKAHKDILNLLLQILDEGRLTDGKGMAVDFRNTVVILTSNLGAELPRYKRMEYLKTQLKPELLARIDDIVPFHGLNLKNLMKIVDIHLRKMIKRARAAGIEIIISDPAREWMSEKVFTAKNGVRELKRLMQHNIENPLAVEIMNNRALPGHTVVVDIDPENKRRLIVINKTVLKEKIAEKHAKENAQEEEWEEGEWEEGEWEEGEWEEDPEGTEGTEEDTTEDTTGEASETTKSDKSNDDSASDNTKKNQETKQPETSQKTAPKAPPAEASTGSETPKTATVKKAPTPVRKAPPANAPAKTPPIKRTAPAASGNGKPPAKAPAIPSQKTVPAGSAPPAIKKAPTPVRKGPPPNNGATKKAPAIKRVAPTTPAAKTPANGDSD